MKTPSEESEEPVRPLDLHPSLEEVVKAHGLDRTKLIVAWKPRKNRSDLTGREDVLMQDGKNGAVWKVPSLRALFRGNEPAPAFGDEPPPAYMPLFFFIEKHVLTFCESSGDRTDGEFEEVYSNLRRRPDGKSTSDLHFFLWQAAAGLLGRWPLSAAEFDAIFGRLTRSARTFQMGVVSRNYVDALRQWVRRLE